ncbi:MAG: tRNA uridine-5-carboxymethylaminomethyl(34) synthesis GTPase MnmE [Oscillibacter sp.]|jgi:tRNA modification GTPase|nr:tRNA uridine-5-carboxymethylaminomethyl(34) synthesis GTPase MnmE [Oscillibacter sp.]
MELIAAIATGSAASAIGIVRLSGDGCGEACGRVFRPVGGAALTARPPRRLVYGDLLGADGAVIDRGLAVFFPGPRSYTGEDSAEFHCHGSPMVLRELLSALFAAGARQAAAGEFTKRAFLNGRMDLTEAEAVADLIGAESPAAVRNAAAQLDGALRRRLLPIQDALLDVTARFYAVVDYPDEEIADVRPGEIAQALEEAERGLGALLATCARGRVLKSGVRTALAGRPNAGKSSLLNALAGFDRAIVTDVPGTTRDTVEESVLCGGVLLRLIDTAGIREARDAVEKLGVERAKAALEHADLALAVVDGTDSAGAPEILELASRCPRWILVLTRRDLRPGAPEGLQLPGTLCRPPDARVSVSCVTGEGLDELESAAAKCFPAGDPGDAGSLLTDARQEDAARRATEAVRRAKDALAAGFTPDAVLTDAEEALAALGELTGRTVRQDLVERIFCRFCVGK